VDDLHYQASMYFSGRVDGREEGRAEGRAEGRKEGHTAGRKEGREEGITAGIIKTANRMLQKGFDVSMVSEITGLTVQEVEDLR
jgi:predicted transposase/invertase (TIGR01784 family)